MVDKEIRSLAFRHNKGPTGGPAGSNALLDIYNSKFHIIPNLKCFYRKEFSNNTMLYNWVLSRKKGSEFVDRLDQLRFLKNCLANSNKKTLFIAHDVWSAYQLAKRKLTYILSYHQQGSLVEELPSLGQYLSEKRIKKIIKMEKKAFLNASKIMFTSKGSLKSFLKTTKQTSADIDKIKQNTEIVYNTCMLYEESLRPQEFEDILIKQGGNKKIILTVSSLSTFKGVDRIPKFLSEVKDFKKEFIWVLCGDGHLENKIYAAIKKYSLKDNFVHIKRRLSQIELQYLYRNSYYYLMMHRLSIFDMATLEAMSNGCIPLLTYVGGNIELNRSNNIIFVNENDKITLRSDNKFLSQKGKQNKEIFNEFFGPETLLKGYLRIISSTNKIENQEDKKSLI